MCEQIKIIEGDIKSDGMAILPGEAVSFFNIPLPDLPAAKLEQILPGVMVEYIAGSIDDAHICIVKKISDGRYLAAVCDNKWMVEARGKAASEGKVLKAIWPDYALLDVPKTDLNVKRVDGRVLVRRPDETGFAIAENMLEHVIGVQDNQNPQEATAVPDGQGLATGKYSPRAPLLIYMRSLARLSIILVVALFVWFIHAGFTILNNENQRLRYADASVGIFKENYPDVKRIVNVEAQMRALLNDGNEEGGIGFLAIANSVFKAVNDTAGIALDSLAYDEVGALQSLNVTILSLNYSQVTSFESSLAAAGYEVLQGASAHDGENILSSYIIREVKR
jgi:general secretion pathway protein L